MGRRNHCSCRTLILCNIAGSAAGQMFLQIGKLVEAFSAVVAGELADVEVKRFDVTLQLVGAGVGLAALAAAVLSW